MADERWHDVRVHWPDGASHADGMRAPPAPTETDDEVEVEP